eukprot:1092124-Rhodomonas_salina.1
MSVITWFAITWSVVTWFVIVGSGITWLLLTWFSGHAGSAITWVRDQAVRCTRVQQCTQRHTVRHIMEAVCVSPTDRVHSPYSRCAYPPTSRVHIPLRVLCMSSNRPCAYPPTARVRRP